MPRSPAQSDFVVYAEAVMPSMPTIEDTTEVEPEVPTLARAIAYSDEASPRATRWVMGFVWFVLAALVILCVVGPHIPAGE